MCYTVLPISKPVKSQYANPPPPKKTSFMANEGYTAIKAGILPRHSPGIAWLILIKISYKIDVQGIKM
jgi:hypothetical protein